MSKVKLYAQIEEMSEAEIIKLKKDIERIEKTKSNKWFIETQIHKLHQCSYYLKIGLEQLKGLDLQYLPIQHEITKLRKIQKFFNDKWKKIAKSEVKMKWNFPNQSFLRECMQKYKKC